MKTIETIFTNETKFDHKNILNRLNKPIDQNILNQIESGITIEQIDILTSQNIPIFKYKTQITIHGIFSELQNNYSFGYKNIFQNKNKSIGIKYNAIDEEKRQRIAKRLQILGFHYHRNSQETCFDKMDHIILENFDSLKTSYLELKNKIDTTLFFGYCNIFIGESFGCKYLCFVLFINAIYENNIELLLNGMGATIELLELEETKKQIREAEYLKELENDRKKRIEAQNKSNESKKDQIELLQTYQRIEKTNLPGMYIVRNFDYENNLIFKVIYIYLLKGKQKPRWNYKEYMTVYEALKHECIENWSDRIYCGRLTGYKIK